MKKVVTMIISILLITCSYNVFAQDTVYSLNKYNEEEFKYIIDGYNNSKVDGKLAVGSYEKKDNRQVMLVKYDKNYNVDWIYSYGKEVDDDIDYVTYSYDEEGNVDGYLFTILETRNKDDLENRKAMFVKVDLEGKLVFEKSSELSTNSNILKLISVFNDDNKFDYYIGISNSLTDSSIIKYDRELNLVWNKKYENNDLKTEMLDISAVRESGKITSYVVLADTDVYNKVVKLLNYDIDGNLIGTIKDNFESKDNPKLGDTDNGFIIYGVTHELKLSKDKDTSYYINKYSKDLELDLELVGNTPVNDEKILKLNITKNNYLLMYMNDLDNSYEIVRIDLDGNKESKIKKITNGYYIINDFIYDGNLYIGGKIDCPEDDNCEYNHNSLFLVSTEDKVIEVAEPDNNYLLIGSILFIGFVIIFVGYKYFKNKKKRLA